MRHPITTSQIPRDFSYGLPVLLFSKHSVMEVMDRDPYSGHVGEDLQSQTKRAARLSFEVLVVLAMGSHFTHV